MMNKFQRVKKIIQWKLRKVCIKKGKGNQAHIPRGKKDKEMKMVRMKQGELENGLILVIETLSIFFVQCRSGNGSVFLVLIHCFHLKSLSPPFNLALASF